MPLAFALAPVSQATSLDRAEDITRLLQAELSRLGKGHPWRVAGRPFPGFYGIARSYEEAREALTLAERLHLDTDVVPARDLLVYRVLGRDQAAIVDLVHAVLDPLTQARGGAEPLLTTLQTYFDTGEIATETARRLHMSVRTVTYRLAKVKTLTGHDPADPTQRFSLHAAVLGARGYSTGRPTTCRTAAEPITTRQAPHEPRTEPGCRGRGQVTLRPVTRQTCSPARWADDEGAQ